MQLPYPLAGASFHHFYMCLYVIQLYRICQYWSHHIWYSMQGFPNSVKRWGRSLSERNGTFCWVFFIGCWESKEEWVWTFLLFLKLKTTFYRYWTLIKSKISVTCVYKEYEVKTKIVQEQWIQLNMKFSFFQGRREELYWGTVFLNEGREWAYF